MGFQMKIDDIQILRESLANAHLRYIGLLSYKKEYISICIEVMNLIQYLYPKNIQPISLSLDSQGDLVLRFNNSDGYNGYMVFSIDGDVDYSVSNLIIYPILFFHL